MKKSQVIIVVVFIIVVVLLEILLFNIGVLPKFIFAEDETLKYAFDMAGVIQTLVSIPLGLKVKNRPALCLGLFGGVINYGILVYYLSNSATTLACATIGVVALLILCILPSKD